MVSFSTIILKESIDLFLCGFPVVHSDLMSNVCFLPTPLYYPILLENITFLLFQYVFIDFSRLQDDF